MKFHTIALSLCCLAASTTLAFAAQGTKSTTAKTAVGSTTTPTQTIPKATNKQAPKAKSWEPLCPPDCGTTNKK